MVRLSSDTTAFQRMVQVSLRIGTRAPLLMIGSLILMFITDSRLAFMILPVLLATSLVIIFFVSRMGPLFMTVQKKLDRLNMVLQENIAGVSLGQSHLYARSHEMRALCRCRTKITPIVIFESCDSWQLFLLR